MQQDTDRIKASVQRMIALSGDIRGLYPWYEYYGERAHRPGQNILDQFPYLRKFYRVEAVQYGPGDTSLYTPMMMAASLCSYEGVKSLLTHGADVSTTRPDGWTAIASSMGCRDARVVRLLFEGGASLDFRGLDGETLLHEAAIGDNVEVVAELLDLGAGINAQDDYGHTPLVEAILSGGNAMFDSPKVFTLLIERGADVNVRDAEGMTALGHFRRDIQPGYCGQDVTAYDELLVKHGGHL